MGKSRYGGRGRGRGRGCGCGLGCGCGCCGGGPVAKCGFFTFNTVFLLAGVVAVGLGIWIKWNDNFYTLFLLSLFAIGIAGASVYGVYKGKMDDNMSKSLNKSFENYTPGNKVAKDWDRIQTWLKCCGSKGVHDYMNKSLSYSQGCYQSLMNIIDRNLLTAILVGVGIALLQILGICLSIGLCMDRMDRMDDNSYFDY